MMFPKSSRWESEPWLRAVASLPCVMCMREGNTQAAHPNHRDKGMGVKSHDCWTVPLCVDCHREFDQGMKFTKMQKREMMDEWIILTVLSLAKNGLVRAVK